MLKGWLKNMKLLVDANFLIDYYARRDEFFDSCTTLLVAESFRDVELWAPAKSFTDVFYVLNQRLKVESPLVQRAFLKSFDFIKLVSLEPADVKEAARRAWDDFGDCLVAVAAEKIGADFIITRDAKGFSRSKIKALDADAFLEWMRQTRGRSYAEMRVTREMIEEACRRASFDA